MATFGLLHAERDREIDGVLADVDLVLQRRRDVDRGVGDDEDLVIRRHVHDEHVTEPAAGAQTRLPRHDRAQQLVRVQAAFHQQLGLALADQVDGLRRGRMAVRRVDDPVLARDRCRSSSRPRGSSRPGPTRIGVISLFAPASMRAGQGRFLAGMRHGRRHGLEAAAALEQQLRTFRFRLRESSFLCVRYGTGAADRRSRLLQKEQSARSPARRRTAAAANAVW